MCKQLALTMGDPSGINGEIICKAWVKQSNNLAPFFVVGDPDYFLATNHQSARSVIVPVEVLSTISEGTSIFMYSMPIIPERLMERSIHGHPKLINTSTIITSIVRAVSYVKNRQAVAITTSPIHKRTLYEAGFPYLGHTEFLSTLSEKRDDSTLHSVMMLAHKNLRVVPVTTHLSLSQAILSLTVSDIITCGRIVAQCLQENFGIEKPRLAVAALNPHAGEEGIMGHEEQDIILPAVMILQKESIHITGPVPADTLFHMKARNAYDAVLCMYHDQALIPLKALSFSGGVNITLGLEFIRTSPDHGTGFDISGYNLADESSLLHALHTAQTMAQYRRSISSN